ncbi:MAG: sodium ion-translocating decarboxylase subunit beta [Clostridia bacterium]|nr:sodium ion-translocating decarboxylase subunit beta [Clostridia bacterium]
MSAVNIGEILKNLWEGSGYSMIHWQQVVMLVVACGLLFLGIAKKFEPLLLVGIAFGMLLTNLPGLSTESAALFHSEWWTGEDAVAHGVDYLNVLQHGGLLDVLYIGVKTGLYPCLIFIGVGAMTDFGPMLANPKSLILGAAAQLGIYMALILAITVGFTGEVAASVAIIGGADGPTAIFVTKTLAPERLGAIAIAAYSYMALIPLIQPPIMRVLTTKKERMIKMDQLRTVSKKEKIIFPIAVTIITCVLLPSVAPLLGCLMFGNLLKECGVTERLSDTAQNALMNIVTLFLGISVGATAQFETFLTFDTLKIVGLGLLAFCFSTAGGVLMGKLMCFITKGKINPLIGAAGVSAVPMAARVAHNEGKKWNPDNYLLMHAMGPNVAGVIGSAVAAGFLLAIF